MLQLTLFSLNKYSNFFGIEKYLKVLICKQSKHLTMVFSNAMFLPQTFKILIL
jgi:hypothetical protein